MAIQKFNATWMGQYLSNGTYHATDTPIRVGSTTGYRSYLGFDHIAILNACNTSLVTPTIRLAFYVTDPAVFEVGYHSERVNKRTNGHPPFRHAGINQWFAENTWANINLTDTAVQNETYRGFHNALKNGFTGIILFQGAMNNLGVAHGVTKDNFNAYIEVEGTWNSRPTTPTILFPRGGEILSGTVELRGTPSTDADHPQSALRYEWKLLDSTVYTSLGLGEPGIIDKVVDLSQFKEGQSRVIVRAFDGIEYSDYAYSNAFTIRHNHPPDKPSIWGPSDGEELEYGKPMTFDWTHNDASNQSAYEIRWREQGTEAWNSTGKVISNEEHVEITDTSVFPKNSFLEWQVRTYDSEDLASDWSNIAIFILVEKTPTPKILSPTSGTISKSRINVRWEAPLQWMYQITLFQRKHLYEEVWNYREIDANTRVKEITYNLENHEHYLLVVRVYKNGMTWSEPSSIEFTTDFTPPAKPIMGLLKSEEGGYIEIRVTNPIQDGLPNALFNQIYKREANSSEPFTYLMETSPNAVYRDFDVAHDVLYEYYVVSYGDNETSSSSRVYQAKISLGYTFLHQASNLEEYVGLKYNPSRSVQYGMNRTLMMFNGRKYPVAEYGLDETWGTAVSFDIRTTETLEHFLRIVKSKEVLLYRDTRGRKAYVTLAEVRVNDKYPTGYTVTFNLDRVDYKGERDSDISYG